jgi:type VI secretion system secreted protein VgrG
MEEQEARFVWIAGGGNNTMLFAGAKFKVHDHSVALPATNSSASEFVLLQVDHRARDFSDMPFDGETAYSNEFVCIPADFSFRPARVTPKPHVRGPQTATVKDGPDNLGRVKVQFPWAPDEQSCWARVAQSWAFNQMGTQFLPRMDSEVVVDFVDGNPDRPIIVGMVYNGKNKLPFAVPANKTQSGVRGANWGDAGVRDKSNELRFEDRSGSEEVYLHAQKDCRRVVANDDSLTVEGGDRKVLVQKGDVTETVELGDRKLVVKQGNVTQTLDLGNHSTKLSIGNHELKLNVGASKTEAMQSITFKVGGNSVTIDQTGISIKGLMVKIEGQVMLDLKSVMTTVNGNAMLTLKGGITMVN